MNYKQQNSDGTSYVMRASNTFVSLLLRKMSHWSNEIKIIKGAIHQKQITIINPMSAHTISSNVN
jgi:hypothetical protein